MHRSESAQRPRAKRGVPLLSAHEPPPPSPPRSGRGRPFSLKRKRAEARRVSEEAKLHAAAAAAVSSAVAVADRTGEAVCPPRRGGSRARIPSESAALDARRRALHAAPAVSGISGPARAAGRGRTLCLGAFCCWNSVRTRPERFPRADPVGKRGVVRTPTHATSSNCRLWRF